MILRLSVVIAKVIKDTSTKLSILENLNKDITSILVISLIKTLVLQCQELNALSEGCYGYQLHCILEVIPDLPNRPWWRIHPTDVSVEVVPKMFYRIKVQRIWMPGNGWKS